MPDQTLLSSEPPLGKVSSHRQPGKKLWLALVLLALVGALSYEVFAIYGPSSTSPATKAPSTNSTSTKSPSTKTSASISHIFIIMMENQPAGAIVGSSAAPYINSLIAQSALATNYSAVSHPSLPNYLALTSGSTDGVTTDCNPPSAGCILSVASIADEIEASGRTWKQYAESMPSPCYALNYGSLFATKHVPFLYYSDIINDAARCNAHIVPYTALSSDLQSAATTPNFGFITPNLCDDMHSCPISTGDTWLSQNIPQILNSSAFTSKPSLLVITWDEGTTSNNIVGAIFAGSAAQANFRSSSSYSHYSLLHTIESLWGLKPLTTNDQNSTLMSDLIRTSK